MAAPRIEKEIFIDFEGEADIDRANAIIPTYIKRFKNILKSYALFNIFFSLLLVSEIAYFLFYIILFIQSYVLAIHLSLIFVTIFSYFTLRVYFQTKKTERLIALKDEYSQTYKAIIDYQDGNPNHYLKLANGCSKFATDLNGIEYKVYKFPSWLGIFNSFIEKVNCRCYWQDVHLMRELLLKASVDEHIKFVQGQPTRLDVHAGLANSYVMLSGLYIDPRTIDGNDKEQWVPPKKYNSDFKQQFRQIAAKAIEEFKILSEYAPQDPWVHEQLAYSYHDLQMPLEEISEYEIILKLCPEDRDTLFKLGKLYFEQGWNAKGLQIYETLKKSNYKKAEKLIQFYGANDL